MGEIGLARLFQESQLAQAPPKINYQLIITLKKQSHPETREQLKLPLQLDVRHYRAFSVYNTEKQLHMQPVRFNSKNVNCRGGTSMCNDHRTLQCQQKCIILWILRPPFTSLWAIRPLQVTVSSPEPFDSPTAQFVQRKILRIPGRWTRTGPTNTPTCPTHLTFV